MHTLAIIVLLTTPLLVTASASHDKKLNLYDKKLKQFFKVSDLTKLAIERKETCEPPSGARTVTYYCTSSLRQVTVSHKVPRPGEGYYDCSYTETNEKGLWTLNRPDAKDIFHAANRLYKPEKREQAIEEKQLEG